MTPKTSPLTAKSETFLKGSLTASIWRAFSFETGDFLLHVPSAHVIEVSRDLAACARGASRDPELLAQLAHLDAALPRPRSRVIEVDIQTVSLNMAQGCNLRCTYCFAGEGDYGSKGMMSHATAVEALNLLSLGKKNFHVIFFGGEPLLNFSVIQSVVQWCKTQPCTYTFSMTTNATLLTTEKLAWLTEQNFALTISYDGRGVHAKQRLNKDKTSNSEALVTRKLEVFREKLGELRQLRLRATVTKATLDHVEEAIVATLSSHDYRLAVARHADNMQAFAFSDEDIAKLSAITSKIVDTLLAQKDYKRLTRFENIMKTVHAIHRGHTHKMLCGAGVHYLTCSVSGSFYLCHRFNEDESEHYGDIHQGLNLEKLKKIAAFRGRTVDPCGSCWMRQWCAGGCFHEHKAATGDKFLLDPHFCQMQAIEMEQAMRVYTHLLQEAPEYLER
jgi:uncharacterized protein